MLTSVAIAALVFLIFVLLGIPIAFSMITAGIFFELFYAGGRGSNLIVPFMQLKNGITFSLLAVYLFVFLGNIMNEAKISDYIVAVARKLIPKIPGRTGMITITSCALMGPLTGSANGTTVSIGAIMFPQMHKHGYDDGYSAALLAYSGILGSLIPPSISGIVYALVTGSSVMAVWMSTLGAGLVYLTMLLGTHFLFSRAKRYDVSGIGERKREGEKKERKYIIRAIPSILVPLSILGGIYGGVVTATEAGALGSFIVLLLGCFFYKSIRSPKQIFSSLYLSVSQTANVMFLICASFALSYILISTQATKQLGFLMLEITSNRYLILLLTEGLLLILGCFMDDVPIMILLAPIASTILLPLGFHPCHIAGCFILVCLIGLITPPVGVVLYAASAVTGKKMEDFLKEIYLFFVPAIVSILIVTFVPGITMFFPRLLHLI